MSIILKAVRIIIESIIKKIYTNKVIKILKKEVFDFTKKIIEKTSEKTEKKKRRMLKIPDRNRIKCCVESRKFWKFPAT